jgi:sucrose synthase
MKNLLGSIIKKNENKDFKELISFVTSQQQDIYLRNGIIQLFREYCDHNRKTKKFRQSSLLFEFFKKVQELFITKEHLVLMHRYAIAKYRFYMVRRDGEYMEEISLSTYLDLKDYYAQQKSKEGHHLHIDFMPFYDFSPSIRDTRSVGNGIRFLNRYLSSNIFSRPTEWNTKLFEFIKLHQYNGRQLLVNDAIIRDLQAFYSKLEQLLERLRKKKPETPFTSVETTMRRSGFEVGWGNTVGRITETVETLLNLINEPTDELLERFISRVPMR